MGRLGLGLGATRKRPQILAAGVGVSSDHGLNFASIRFPPENGENAAGVNGGLSLPNSNQLLQTAIAGDLPLLASDGAIAVIWKVPRDIYNGLRRSPVILGTDRSAASNTAANQLRLSYVTGADNSNTANVNKFRLFLQGDAANGSVDVLSSAVPDSFSDWLIVVPRIAGGSISIDILDVTTGQMLIGPGMAVPAQWAGLNAFARDLGLGIFRHAQFPQDGTDLFGNTGYARGECAGLLFLESAGDDADWASFALGADPLALWPGKVRAWFPLSDGQSIDLAMQTNLATPAAYSADLSQHGTLLPGSTARQQSQTQFLRVNNARDPALVPVYNATMLGEFRITLSMAGQTAGAPIEALVLNKGGAIVSDWNQVGIAQSSGEVEIAIELQPGTYRMRFRVSGGSQCELNSDIVVGPGILFNGQSQCDYTFGFSINEVDSASSNLTFDPSVGGRTFVAARSRVAAAALQRPALFRAGEKPGILGDGFIAAANRLAKDIPSHWPIILIDTSVSGTTLADTLADAPSPQPTAPDVRDMADIYAITDLLMGRDSQNRAAITCWAQFWHSSGSVVNYAQAYLRPLLEGITTDQVPIIDDYPYSGNAIHPNFPFLHFEPNRIISSVATSNPPTSQDERTEHQTRQNLRDNEASMGYALGAPIDVHRLEQDVFTHPAVAERLGSAFVAESVIQSVKPVIGLSGGYAGPVEVVSAAFANDDNNQIDVTFDGPTDFALATLDGGTISGFEVENSRSGFSASVLAPDTIRLTKDEGAWPGAVSIELKPGGPGDYGSSHDEAAYVSGALINLSDGCLVRGTGTALVTSGGGTVAPPTSGNPEDDLIASINATAGQSSYHDYSTAGGSPWVSLDRSANGNDHTQSTAFRFPGSNGEFDGTTAATQPINGGLFSVVMAFTKTDASTRGYLVALTSNPGIQYLEGSGIALAFTTRVNGVVANTEGDLYAALHQTGQAVIQIEGINRNGDTLLTIGRNSSSAQGTIPKIAVLDEAALGAALVQARANASLAVIV